MLKRKVSITTNTMGLKAFIKIVLVKERDKINDKAFFNLTR